MEKLDFALEPDKFLNRVKTTPGTIFWWDEYTLQGLPDPE